MAQSLTHGPTISGTVAASGALSVEPLVRSPEQPVRQAVGLSGPRT
jgi:hypothetical protein